MANLLRSVLAAGLGAAMMTGIAAADTKRSFVVGVENLDYRPAYGVDAAGDYQGYARAVLDAFAADADYELTYRSLPVPRLFASLLAGTVDFKFPDNPMWSSDQKAAHEVVYSLPVMFHIDGTLVSRDHAPERIETLGTVTGFTAWAWQEQIDQGSITVAENADLMALGRQVLAGRVDGAYANIAVMTHQVDQELGRTGALVFRADLPHVRGTYHLSTTLHPEVIAEFDRWLETNAEAVTALQAEYGVALDEALEQQ